MSHSLATEADFILAGYRAGYYSTDDVIAWADRQIERLAEPPTALLDLSMGRRLYPVDFINLLRTLSPGDGSVAIQIQLGFIGARFLGGQITLESAIRRLYELTFSDEPGLTPELNGTLFQLDDEYHLAIEGVYSTTEQVEVQLREFIGPYADGLKSYGLPERYVASEAN